MSGSLSEVTVVSIQSRANVRKNQGQCDMVSQTIHGEHTHTHTLVCDTYNKREISALSSTNLISVHVSVWQQLSELVLENVKLLPVVKLQPIISLQLAGWSAATVSCGKKSSLLFRRSFLSHTLLMLEDPKKHFVTVQSFLLISSCCTTAPAPQNDLL